MRFGTRSVAETSCGVGGCGVRDGQQVLIDESWQGRRWVVETDITTCFSAIQHEKWTFSVLTCGCLDGCSVRFPCAWPCPSENDHEDATDSLRDDIGEWREGEIAI